MRSDLDISAFAIWTGIERSARILGAGAVLMVMANALQSYLRRFYGTYLLLATCGFLVLLSAPVARWA